MNKGKATIVTGLNGLSITIPSKKNWFGLLFGTVWMGGWYFGLTNVFGMLVLEEIDTVGANGFIVFWLLAWTAGGLAIAFILLWGYFGKERWLEDGNLIHFEKTVFGIGKKTKLDKKEIKNFRTEFGNDNWLGGNRWAFWGLGPGKIKMDCGLKTYSFGLGLDDAEANYIVGLLREKFEDTKTDL